MKTEEDIEKLEKLIGQLQGLHNEITILSKKSPNDAVNPFKLKLINKVLTAGNEVLIESYKPFDDFNLFELDDVPSNSDVTLVIAQYIEAAETYRSAHIKISGGSWAYILNGKSTTHRTNPPTRK